MVRFLYGTPGSYRDVTDLLVPRYIVGDKLILPSGQARRQLLDTVSGLSITVGDDSQYILIPDQEAMTVPFTGRRRGQARREWWRQQVGNLQERLPQLHQFIYQPFGSMLDQYPEQLALLQYISPQDTVLELGAGIGCLSCIIAIVLDDDCRLITVTDEPNRLEQVRD